MAAIAPSTVRKRVESGADMSKTLTVYWVAVKELNLNHSIGGTYELLYIFIYRYTHYGNLI